MINPVKFIIESFVGVMELPINPPNFEISQESGNEETSVVELGDIIIPRQPKLKTTSSLSSYFPSLLSDENAKPPMEYVQFFQKIWDSKKPFRLTITGLEQESILFLIQSFNYDKRGGEHEDVYFTLDLKEYKPYGATTIKINQDGQLIPPIKRDTTTKTEINRIYEVVPADTVQSITRKNGGSDWTELYKLNKVAIGNDVLNLKAGTELKIPESWVSK